MLRVNGMSDKVRNIIIASVFVLFAFWEFYMIGYTNGYIDGAQMVVEFSENE